jgi:hypothetical protein
VLAPRASDDRGRCGGPSSPSSSGRHWTKRQAKALPTWLSVSTTAASSGVVVLLGGVLLRCFLFGLCLPGENLSPVLRRSGDGGFGVISFLGASLWKTNDLLRLRFGFTGVGSCVAWLGN